MAAGMLGAVAIGRLLQRVLVPTSATDPVIFGSIAALLATVLGAAAFFPARRATRVDPLAALRHE